MRVYSFLTSFLFVDLFLEQNVDIVENFKLCSRKFLAAVVVELLLYVNMFARCIEVEEKLYTRLV